MNENSFSLIIRKIVQRGESLHIQGFGDFFSEDVPACFSDNGKVLNPPQRMLMFRHSKGEQIDLSGSVLVSEYMSMKRCMRSEAELSVSEFLHGIQRELSENRFFTLPGAGVLRSNSEGDVFFVQDRNADMFPENFGFIPVCVSVVKDCSSENVCSDESDVLPVPDLRNDIPVGEGATWAVGCAGDPGHCVEGDDVSQEHLYGYEQHTETVSVTQTETGKQRESSDYACPHRMRRTSVVLVSAVLFVLLAVVLVYVFREDIGPVFRHVMYSEDELQLLERAGRL